MHLHSSPVAVASPSHDEPVADGKERFVLLRPGTNLGLIEKFWVLSPGSRLSGLLPGEENLLPGLCHGSNGKRAHYTAGSHAFSVFAPREWDRKYFGRRHRLHFTGC